MLVAAVLSVAATMAVADGACKINLKKELIPDREPLILKIEEFNGMKYFGWIWPEVEIVANENVGVLNIAEGGKLLFACLGQRNSLVASRQQTATGTCSQSKIYVNGVIATKDNYLACKSGVPEPYVVNTGKSCGDNNKGTKFLIGFRLLAEQNDQYLPLVEVCHNIDKMFTYYTSHQLIGNSINGAVRSDKRRTFRQEPKGTVFKGVNPETSLSCNVQKATLKKILGTDEYVKLPKVYIARGHLSPHADFIFNSGSQLTYYFINAAPQWQNFNCGNWLKVENAVRRLAAAIKATFNVWTGTYGTMKLEAKDKSKKEIYIFPEKETFPLPEIFWKLVQNPATGSCVVAVGHNNVHLQTDPTPICDPVEGWPSLRTRDQGYVYYCSYDSFKRVVGYIPDVPCPHSLWYQSAAVAGGDDDPSCDSNVSCDLD